MSVDFQAKEAVMPINCIWHFASGSVPAELPDFPRVCIYLSSTVDSKAIKSLPYHVQF